MRNSLTIDLAELRKRSPFAAALDDIGTEMPWHSSPPPKESPSLHHLSIYQLATQTGGAVTLKDVPAVSDPAVTLVNSHPIFPVPVQAIMAYVGQDTHITRAFLTTPKLRAINQCYLRPMDIAAATVASRPPVVEFFHHPLSLNPIDENQVLMTTSANVTTPNVAIWFGDGNFNVPQGDLITIHASQSITLVSGGWAYGTITLDSPLPAGRYSVIGASAFGTNMLFFRLIFPNQVWRPGGIAGLTAAFIDTRYHRWGNLGEWGQFETFALPQLDTFGSSAGAQTIDLSLDIVRVR